MFKLRWLFGFVALLGVLMLGGRAIASPLTATGVKLTITVKSAYARSEPRADATRIYSVFKDQTYNVLNQDATRTWVRLDVAGVAAAWVPLSYGTLAGDLSGVPVTGEVASPPNPNATPGPTAVPTSGASSPPINWTGIKFTLTAKSAYARVSPDWNAAKHVSLFKGQTFLAVGRDATSAWLQIVLNDNTTTWVSVGAGQLAGSILSLPVVDGSAVGNTAVDPKATPPPTQPPWIPALTASMRQAYNQVSRRGLNKLAFAVAGDCNFEDGWYRELIVQGVVNIPGYEYLQPTINTFRASLLRNSVAVNGGFRTSSMMDPMWSDPKVCLKGEGPLACEMRITRAGIVFVGLGTGDQFAWEQYETHYREILDYIVKKGAFPILVTKADDLEFIEGGAQSGYINSVIRRLGAEYNAPVFDFAVGAKTLPNGGLKEEEGNDFHLSTDGMGMHILGMIQVLYVLTHP